MPSVDAKTVQADFSAGMFRAGRRDEIPPNGLYDASNGLIERLGGVYKRGGTEGRSGTFSTGPVLFLWDGILSAGHKTVVGTATHWGVLGGGSSGKASGIGQKVSGTTVTDLSGTGLVTMGNAAAYNGVVYLPGGNTYSGSGALGTAAKVAPYYAVSGHRLLAASGDRVDMSEIKAASPTGEVQPAVFAANDYHKLPGGIEITGLYGLRDRAVVFTTGGIWIISGLAKQLVDASGNVQQSLDLYSADFALWGAGGVCGWEGELIVPGTDGVYLMGVGVSSERRAFTRISDPIVALYQEYVRSGYTPGQATVFKNHYFLPVIGPTGVVDHLVCRLDLPSRPWTRLEGAGARSFALATRIVGATPELLGGVREGSSGRVVNCFYLEPGGNSELDHDASPINFSLTTRAFVTGNLVPNLVRRVRLRYELAGATASIGAAVMAETEQPPASATTWGDSGWGEGEWSSPGQNTFEPLDGAAPVEPGGALPKTWYPRRKRRFVTFRFTSTAQTSKLQIRSLEMFARLSGRT